MQFSQLSILITFFLAGMAAAAPALGTSRNTAGNNHMEARCEDLICGEGDADLCGVVSMCGPCELDEGSDLGKCT